MELVQILKSLWMRRGLVAVGALIALVLAVAMYMKGQSVRVGTASAEILIDAEESALGDLRRDTLPLVARSGIFARFLGADGATDAIAREAGISKKDIAVVGPKLQVDGVPDPESAERASKLRGNASHLLQVQQGDDLPLLTIYTQAPTKEEAGRLANVTAVALEEYVSGYQEQAGIPDKRRVKIRQLGPARASYFESEPGLIMPFAAFCFIFGLSCFAILAWPRMRATWRDNASPGGSADDDSQNGDLFWLPTDELLGGLGENTEAGTGLGGKGNRRAASHAESRSGP